MSEKHVIGAEIEIEVRDKNGRLLEHKKQESRSFLKQFLQMLYGEMNAENLSQNIISITTTGGGTSNYPSYTDTSKPFFRVTSPSGNDYYGILVGESDEPVEYDDYNLKSKIPNGTGAGQLSYQECTLEEPYKDGTEYKFKITRAFVNNSGATITVKEVGIGAAWKQPSIVALLIRDVLASPTSIPDGATLTVRYYIKVSVP